MYSRLSFLFIILFLVVLGLFFWEDVFLAKQVQMRGFFNIMPWLFVGFVPALTMRIWSEERKTGTFETLITFPSGMWKIIMAKFFASLSFVVLILLCSLPYVAFLSNAGELDFGPVIGSYIGVLLLASSSIAIGLWASSITKSQVAAFVVGAVIIGLLHILALPLSILPSEGFAQILFAISSQTHFEALSKGVIDARDVIYFVSIAGLFLFYNYISLNSITTRNA